MPRAPSNTREAEIKRILKAVMAAGITVFRVEIERGGKFAVIPGVQVQPEKKNGGGDEWADI